MRARKERPANDTWNFQEAKARLNELLDVALIHGPQIITRRGDHTGVLMSHDDYTRLVQATTSLADVFSHCTEPLPYVRDSTLVHSVDLEECT